MAKNPKYKPLKDLEKESLRVRFANTRDSLLNRAEGLEVSEEKLREVGLSEAANECAVARLALMQAHRCVGDYIKRLEQE